MTSEHLTDKCAFLGKFIAILTEKVADVYCTLPVL